MTFRYWLLGSILLTGLAFVVGPGEWMMAVTFHSSNDVPDPERVTVAVWLGWLWTACFVAGFFNIGRRALWLLLEAPFVLAWPLMWIWAGGCNWFVCR